jgi:hypothetical protein
MDIQTLLNHNNIHSSPAAERFYRLQLQQSLRQPNFNRPPSFSTQSIGFRNPRAHELTRDEKLEIRTLRKYNKWSYITLAKETHHTYRQVQQACQQPLTPQKKVNHFFLPYFLSSL